MAKTRDPIRLRWAKALEPFGYHLDGSVLERKGDLVWPVVVKSPHRRQKGVFQIHLCIVMRDPFESGDDAQDEVILRGYLGRAGVTTLHHDGPYEFWSASEMESSAAALVHHGLPWLDRYRRIDELISYFAEMLEKGMPDGDAHLTWFNRLAARVILRNLPKTSKPRRPPTFHHYLSILHWRQGDREKACFHCRKWLEHALRTSCAGEPERTLRQFEAMGCGDNPLPGTGSGTGGGGTSAP